MNFLERKKKFESLHKRTKKQEINIKKKKENSARCEIELRTNIKNQNSVQKAKILIKHYKTSKKDKIDVRELICKKNPRKKKFG